MIKRHPLLTLVAVLIFLPVLFIVNGACSQFPENPETPTPFFPVPESENGVLNYYFAGNSLVRSITPDRLHYTMKAAGIDFQFGSQLGGGKKLYDNFALLFDPKHWETGDFDGTNWEPYSDPDDAVTNDNPRFGAYTTALKDFDWDGLVLQPYQTHLQDDYDSVLDFINYARQYERTESFWIYMTWPRKTNTDEFDYQSVWDSEYPSETINQNQSGSTPYTPYNSRSHYYKLIEAVNDHYGDSLQHPVRMIPVGDVLYEFDKRAKANNLPGLIDLYNTKPGLFADWDEGKGLDFGANMFYADLVHPVITPHLDHTVSNFIICMTMASVFSGETPVGLDASFYGLNNTADAAVIQTLQQLVWDVVSTHPYTDFPQ